MRLLLDSHILIWWLADDPRLTAKRRRLIARADVCFSSISIWEILLKVSSGRLDLDPHRLMEALAREEFRELPLTSAHARRAVELPLLHRDPVDRFLVAQALVDERTLVTDDETVRAYAVATA